MFNKTVNDLLKIVCFHLLFCVPNAAYDYSCCRFRCLVVGSTWQPDPCRTCTCKNEIGSVDCNTKMCAAVDCEQGYHLVYVEGECCPMCGKYANHLCCIVLGAFLNQRNSWLFQFIWICHTVSIENYFSWPVTICTSTTLAFDINGCMLHIECERLFFV